MKLSPTRIVLILAGVGAVCLFTGETTDFSAVCERCLRKERGYEYRTLGVLIHSSHKPHATHDQEDAIFMPPIPRGKPEILDEIRGSACSHAFKRHGFGRSPWLGGVACGGYPEAEAFKPRRYALSALCLLYGRVPDLALARRTYEVIDHALPADLPPHAAMTGWAHTKELNNLSAALLLGTTQAHWATALDHFTISPATLAPFVENPDFLLGALQSADPIRSQTGASVVTWNKPVDDIRLWNALLSSRDRWIVNRASDSILANRRFDLFGAMLRARPLSPFNDEYWLSSYKDEELQLLLRQDDPEVDKFCFAAIVRGHRLHLIDLIVARLNERDTPEARQAIANTLRGPTPISMQERDAWEATTLLPLATVEEVRERLDRGPRTKKGNPLDFLHAAKTLAHSGSADDWDFLKTVYLREVENRISETYGAVLARALWELAPARTHDFLVAELLVDDHQRQSAALAGMGLIASAEFISEIEAFQTHPPKASPTNLYPAESIFKNHHYAGILNYALHRCRGVHRWQLLTEGGRYYLQKGDSI
ncbi:MAG TPA: hypothetical protein VIO38_07780 [Rariglobus sp.]